MQPEFENISSLQPLGILLLFFVAHLLTGVLAGAVLPFVRGYRPPVQAGMERAGLALERRLNRPERSARQLVRRGLFVVLLMGVAGGLFGGAVQSVALRHYGWVAEFILLALSVSVLAPLKTLRAVLKALEKDNRAAAALILAPCVDEDISKQDSHALIRKALEFAAVSFNRFCIAPVFFFAILHPVGLVCIVVVLALHDVFGAASPDRVYFGSAIRIFEQIFNYIPARISVFLMVLAAVFVPKANPLRGLKTAWNQARFFTPKNKGCVVAAMAGCLGVTLGGRILQRSNNVIENKWIGPEGSSAQASTTDLQRGAMLIFVSYLWLIVMVSGAFLAINLFS